MPAQTLARPVRLLVEMSAEHPTLPEAELSAVLGLVGGRIEERDLSVALAEAPDEATPFLQRRLALSHHLSAHWWSTAATPRAVIPPFGRIQMHGERFAIRARRVEGAHPDFPLQDTMQAAGAVLAVAGKVDLKNPELEIRLVVAQEQAHVGALVADVDRKAFDARHVKHRAHFAPVSLHPRYARTLVNLAQVREGDRVGDPFCGTGGLLVEAGLVGAQVFAGDLDPRMVEGTRLELERQGIAQAYVEARDVGELPEWAGPLDVVLSDPPYGRSSTTNREAMDNLYDRFFGASHDALKPGGRLGLIVPSERLRQRACDFGFRMIQQHDQRVHRSMTRHWAIYARQ